MSNETTERQRRILARLVTSTSNRENLCLRPGWPAQRSVSSATVRNILARLEDQGLVHQPTRGPRAHRLGYRMYVDGLRRPGRSRACRPRSKRASPRGHSGRPVENASELSRASQHIGFALEPTGPSIRLRHIDFVNLEGQRARDRGVDERHITHKVIGRRSRAKTWCSRRRRTI